MCRGRRQPQRAGGRDDVQRDADPRRRAQAERRDQPEAGGDRAERGAGGVGGVEQRRCRGGRCCANQSAAIGKVAPIAAAGMPSSARLIATRTSANRPGPSRRRTPTRAPGRRAQRQRQQRARDGDDDLERRVGAASARSAVDVGGRSPGEPRAERETAHERREHRAGRGDRVTELQREQPRPRRPRRRAPRRRTRRREGRRRGRAVVDQCS